MRYSTAQNVWYTRGMDTAHNPRHYTHDTFLSPFTWRYGSPEMRHLFSEQHRRTLWRQVWVALARVQHTAGLVTQAQVDIMGVTDYGDLPATARAYVEWIEQQIGIPIALVSVGPGRAQTFLRG